MEDDLLSTLAVHLYLLQAVGAVVYAPSTTNSINNNNNNSQYYYINILLLLRSGDFLFVLGSLIDVVISYLDLEGMEDSHVRQMQVWALASALLWLADAISYLLADAVEYSRYHHHHHHHSNVVLVEQSVAADIFQQEEGHHHHHYNLLVEESSSSNNRHDPPIMSMMTMAMTMMCRPQR
jgi:hypothetical protein